MSQNNINKKIINWELVGVNPTTKNWDWKDLFCFWGVSIQSIIGFSLIASLYTIYDLNTFVVFFGSILGSFLIYIFSNLIGKPSQKYGLPFVTFLRTSIGYKGAKYFGFLRSLIGIFMFGIQTYFLSRAVTYLIRILIFSIDKNILEQEIFLTFLLGMNIIDWLSLIICIIFQIYFFSRGMVFNKKIINFSAVIVYSGLLFFFIIVLLTDVKLTSNAFSEILNFNNFMNTKNIAPLFTVAGTIFAYFSIIIISFGDFSRYTKDEKQLKKGNLSLLLEFNYFFFLQSSLLPVQMFFSTKKFTDMERIFTNPTDIIGKFDNLQLTVVGLLFIVIASASTNLIANFIPSQYSLINFIPSKLSLKKVSLTIGFFGLIIGILWPSLLSQIGILSLIDTFGSFFGPLVGVMVINYYLINNSTIEIKDLHKFSYEEFILLFKGLAYKSNLFNYNRIYIFLIYYME